MTFTQPVRCYSCGIEFVGTTHICDGNRVRAAAEGGGMTLDLDAVRARDAADDLFRLTSGNLSTEGEKVTALMGAITDRRALLAALDRARVDLAIAKRFWVKVVVHPTNGCWYWTGSRDEFGYGSFSDGGVTRKATHVAWRLDSGSDVPEGMYVLHSCDNPFCVRPDHLAIGTHADNMADMVAKGRSKWPQQPFCRKGLHAMEGRNVIYAKPPRHGRSCRACRNATNRAREAAKR